MHRQFEVFVLAEGEGKNIAAALVSSEVLVVVPWAFNGRETIQFTVFWFTSKDKCCHA